VLENKTLKFLSVLQTVLALLDFVLDVLKAALKVKFANGSRLLI